MKKLYVFAILLSITTLVFGQTYLTEDFSGNVMPPTGWSLDGLPAQWSISSTTNAGGTAPEAKFTYISGVTVTRLVSPEVDLTGLTSVFFSFKRFYDWYANPAPKLGVATRSGGGNWNSVWEVTPTGNQGPGDISFEIENNDVGASDFQICIYLDGNMYNLDYVFLDNLILFLPFNLDAGMTAITTPSYISGMTEVTGTFKNFGTDQVSDVEVSWQIDEGDVYTTSFTGLGLDFGDTYDFTCEDMFELPIGAYDLNVWISSVNGGPDDDPENDMMMKPISVISYVVPKLPCFEEFTSSTCAPCASFNASFVPWCEQHADQISLVKY
ncbi:MAG: hypothetical protein JW731_15395 [Bacteroidales bacterium]|nr:hypothetical protein [Bacteroidales bacterium]